MRRSYLVLVGAAVTAALAAIPARAAAQTDTVTVGIGGTLSAPTGSEFVVPVYADMRKAPGQKLGSYTIRVTWDPSQLSFYGFDSVSVGTFAEPVPRTDSTGYGVLVVGGVSVQGRDSVVDLFRLHLYSYATGSTPITLQVQDLSAAGTPFTDLLADTATAVQVQSGTFCPSIGRWGDLDADGAANSRDALAILSGVVGLPVDTTIFTPSLGDVDGDGKIDSRDALIILSYGVGLPISGERVLLVAPGACTTATTPTLAILPDTADLAPRQSVQLRVQTIGAGGAPTTVTGVNWSVANDRVAAVDGSGLLFANDPGTTTVTAALGPGVSVSGVVRVAARKVWYVNAAQSARSSTQLGSQRYPFASPEYAFPFASEGDTVRIAAGVTDYVLGTYTAIPVGVVIIGDTLSDGTRPVVRAPANAYDYGFYWTGGDHAEVENLVMRGFYAAAYADGVRSLVFRNVRVEQPSLGGGYGIYANSGLDSLLVLSSDLVADTAFTGYDAIYFGGHAGFIGIQDSKLLYWGDGIYVNNGADSLDMQRSEVGFFSGYGVALYGGSLSGSAVTLSHNYIHDAYYAAVNVSNARSVAFDHNVLFQTADDVIDVYAAQTGMGKLTMLGDSIKFRADDYDWIYANDLDSVSIDSLRFQNDTLPLFEYGDIYANHVRVTNSTFQNVYYEPLYVDAGDLLVDHSSFTGCPACGLSAYAIWAVPYSTVGPRVTVTNSQFQRVWRAVYATNTGTSAGPMIVTGNRVDSVNSAFYVYGDSVVITDDTLTNMLGTGVYTEPSMTPGVVAKTAVIARNQMTCIPTQGASGIYSYYQPMLIEDNQVTDCAWGIYGYGASGSPTMDMVVQRNTVVSDTTSSPVPGIWADGWVRPTIRSNHSSFGSYGIEISTGDTATAIVDSNVVTQTSQAGIYTLASGPVTGQWNNVTNNRAYGIQTPGSQAVTLTNGRIVGNALYGVYNSGSGTVSAASNWWGVSGTVGGGVADSVFGTVDVSSPLSTDPAGSSVPTAPPSAGAVASSLTAAPAPVRPVVIDSAGASRAAARAAHLARRAARERAQVAADAQRHQAARQKAPQAPKLGPPPGRDRVRD